MPLLRLVRTSAETLGCLLLGASALAVQTSPATVRPDRTRTLSTAKSVMKAARYASFITLGEKHQPQARIVDPMGPDEKMTVYIATNPLSRKVREVKKDPRVTLLYFDADRPAYVTLIGRAQAVFGSEKASHFKADWSAFFSIERPETYVLYRVDVSRIEVVSPKEGLSGDPLTWRPDIVDIR